MQSSFLLMLKLLVQILTIALRRVTEPGAVGDLVKKVNFGHKIQFISSGMISLQSSFTSVLVGEVLPFSSGGCAAMLRYCSLFHCAEP
jgi:hypothetical protein